MSYDPERHHRRSIRLKGYDYSQIGAYFVTICAQGRQCLFGEIVNGIMRLNDAGRMVERWWLELNHKYPTVETDEYSVMPNHFHGVILITAAPTEPTQPDEGQPHRVAPTTADDVGAALRGRPHADDRPMPAAPHEPGQPCEPGQPHRVAPTTADDVGAALRGRPVPDDHTTPAAPTLGDIMDWFKTMTTNEYIRGVKTLGWPPFDRRVWQRNYYEHIIRSEAELDRVRAYIANNPLKWALDMENPRVHTPAKPGEIWHR